jgi:ABC-type transport system involved in cytochrome bd biosynthesis fused ATPase/permease subunit
MLLVEELPSELIKRLESIANKVLEEVKPRFQWYENFLPTVLLFFVISALIVLIIS